MSSITFKATVFGLAALLASAVVGTARAQDRDQVRANLQRADVNRDGQLDLDEFTTFINLNADAGIGRAPMIRRSGRYAQAFSTLDTNRDGRVSREEIAAQSR
jgi:Ca2+-binding EF-hand superfamily protein